MGFQEEKLLLSTLANRVKELRTKKGVTQQQAFIDSGVHFGRVEQGKRDASITTINKICNYFEISITEFFETGFNKF